MSEGFTSTRLEEEREKDKRETFKFKNTADLIDWYFSTAYEVIEEQYTSVFQKRLLMKVVKGIHIDLINDIKKYQNEGGTIRKSK